MATKKHGKLPKALRARSIRRARIGTARWACGHFFGGLVLPFAAVNPLKGFGRLFPGLHHVTIRALAVEWTLSGRPGAVKRRGFLADVDLAQVVTWAITQSDALRGMHLAVLQNCLPRHPLDQAA